LGEVELARECFPDNELAAKIAVRKASDAEEAATYVADMDTQIEEQGVLEVARAATLLRGEGSGAGINEDDYVHLDDDDDLDADLLTDAKVVEDAAKQRALMASFEMQHRDQSAR
jgi:hypothetical protein